MNRTKPTLMIGIPAYNEESTIGDLIMSMLSQSHDTYTLTGIFVICDGSIDNTKKIVTELSRSNPIVHAVDTNERISKTSKLNYLYTQNTSDLLLTLDADIYPADAHVVDALVQHNTETDVSVTAASMIPIRPKGFIPKIIYTVFCLWNEIRYQIPTENHIGNLYGQASLIRKSLTKSVTYPEKITGDEEYLFISANRADGFSYARNAVFFYHTMSTYHELRLLSFRAGNERFPLLNYFGTSVIHLHHVPLQYKLKGTIVMFMKSPFYTLLAFAMKLSLSVIPVFDPNLISGKWVRLHSTKKSFSGVRDNDVQL